MAKSCDYVGREVEQSHCDNHLTCVRCLAAERCRLEREVARLRKSLSNAKSTLWAIAKSYNDDELRQRALETYDELSE